MNNEVFGEVKFNTGWETTTSITYNKKEYSIVVSADAYFEKEGITKEQEISYADFKLHKSEILGKIEEKINDNKYIPALLLIKRDGSYGLIFDDKQDIEGGVVVTIKPKMEIVSVNQYL